MRRRPVIVLTGGPGGGKSTLLEELQRDPAWAGQFVALPETVHYARFLSISPGEKLFQRVMVRLQMALEEGVDRALGPSDPRPILCHRGSLDPLAFWMQRGWPEEAFFAFTETTRSAHYQRYTGVLHLVTAADGALSKYTRWPDAHRPESPEEAVRLDRWLQQAWSAHPAYVRIDNEGRDWKRKSKEAQHLLSTLLHVKTGL
ncbi:MAG: ATP-binding protein [Candidatus Methylomirabilia bacterium]